jgi:cell division transport system permease protein
MKKRNTVKTQRYDPGRYFRIWLYQHAQAFVFSLGEMFRNLFNNLMSIAVIGIALALPAGFYLVLANAQQVMANWDGNIQVTLYLKQGVGEARALSLARYLREQAEVASVNYVSRDQALEEYKRLSGFGDALDALDENPLPSLLLVKPRVDVIDTRRGDELLQRLSVMPEVDTAQVDRQWVRRLLVILQVLQRAVIVLSCLLAVAVLLIIGNTIRLAIFNRKTEIEINKLFGATDAFVRRPFLYSGFIHGLLGGLIAWLLIVLSMKLLDGPVARLAALYHSHFQLTGFSPGEFLALVLAGGVLGLAGSWLAVYRHLKDVEAM